MEYEAVRTMAAMESEGSASTRVDLNLEEEAAAIFDVLFSKESTAEVDAAIETIVQFIGRYVVRVHNGFSRFSPILVPWGNLSESIADPVSPIILY